jgi:hypothetical protein
VYFKNSQFINLLHGQRESLPLRQIHNMLRKRDFPVRIFATFAAVVPIGPLTLLYVALYAEELLKAGHAEESLSVIDRHLATLKFPSGYYLAEVHRVRGECLATVGRLDEASEQLEQAHGLATELGSHLFALRSAMARMTLCGNGAGPSPDFEQSLAAIGETDWPEIVAARSTQRPGTVSVEG